MTSQKSEKGVRSKRGATLHVYVQEKNKKWAEMKAAADGLSISHFVDMLLSKLREK